MNLGADNYFTDFRAFLDDLERRGKLYRWRQRVNKDTELMPLMRLQYRGLPDDKRQVLLFEKICDGNGRQFDVKVATGMYGSSREILGLGMGCEDPGAIYEKWHRALAKPLPPRLVDFSPLHEEVYSGSRLRPIRSHGFAGAGGRAGVQLWHSRHGPVYYQRSRNRNEKRRHVQRSLPRQA